MVAPTYYLAANIFRGTPLLSAWLPGQNHVRMLICVDCGYSQRITGIPEDDEGLDIAELESQIEIFEREEEGEVERPGWQNWTYRYVFYGVPTFSNPTGSIMSLTRRTQLLEVPLSPYSVSQTRVLCSIDDKIARKYNMLLITDDVYDLLTYTNDPIPPRLVTLDASVPMSKSSGNIYGNTISNCSFSKLLAPGLRFGFIEASKPLVHELSTQYPPSPSPSKQVTILIW